jgi:hypothetical protein
VNCGEHLLFDLAHDGVPRVLVEWVECWAK